VVILDFQEVMSNKIYEKLSQTFPFISILTYGDGQEEFVGIIQNTDTMITSLYDFGLLTDEQQKREFLTLAEKWYFESNRQLPINIYLKDEWTPFEKIFRTFMTKEVNIIHGPIISLAALSHKKKRRSITVVAKIK
jgi:hypothetical protein